MFRLNRLVALRSIFPASAKYATGATQMPQLGGFGVVEKVNVTRSVAYEIHSVNSLVASVLSSDMYMSVCRSLSCIADNALWFSSTLKKRRSKMNKHKLRKRKKLMRKNTKQSRN